MPTKPIPIHSALSDVYTPTSLLKQGARWNELLTSFQSTYGVKAEKVCRAPGRVNVIGDHIDYCGLSVLPAAIERDVLIAYSTAELPKGSSLKQPSKTGKTVVHLQNMDPAYRPREYEIDLTTDGSDIEMPAKHDWSSYFLAGVKGILMFLNDDNGGAFKSDSATPAHLQILLTGSVPAGSGLSSSSAMVVASSATIMEASNRRESVGRRDFTQVCIAAERLVGVNSGGMDQAASVFSEPLNLLHIEFMPELKATPIPLPTTKAALSFVISNTLVKSDKRSTAKFCYNLRVVETRLAARLLAHHLNVALPPPAADGSQSLTFESLITSYFNTPPPHPGPKPENPPTHLPPTLPTVPALPASHLPPAGDRKTHELKVFMSLAAGALGGPGKEDGETWEEVYQNLEESEEIVQKEVVGKSEVEPIGGKLKIWRRTRHVLSEALRVYDFCTLLKSASSSGTGEADDSTALLEQLGQLMRDSQESARVDSEHSCPEIDEMVQLALSMGALGCRATGAGWGGATVSLVPEPKVADFVKGMREKFYANHYPDLKGDDLDDACFATKPEAGACVVALEE